MQTRWRLIASISLCPHRHGTECAVRRRRSGPADRGVEDSARSRPAPPPCRRVPGGWLAAFRRAAVVAPAPRRPSRGRRARSHARRAAGELQLSHSEIYALAAPLVARAGLEQLQAIDDHTADAAKPADTKAYGAAISEVWDKSRNRRAQAHRR